MTTFRDIPIGARFTQRVAGVVFSSPLVLTKVEEYTRGRYETVNAHYHNVQGHLCRTYIYPSEDVEEAPE